MKEVILDTIIGFIKINTILISGLSNNRIIRA